MENHKICSRCKESKPLGDFHKNRYTKDGYHGNCKACRNPRALDKYHEMMQANEEAAKKEKERRHSYIRVWWQRKKETSAKSKVDNTDSSIVLYDDSLPT